MNREKFIRHIIAEQQKTIDNLQAAVDRFRNASNIDENDTVDPEDYAHQSEAKDMQLRYENMLNHELRELDFLNSIAENEIEEVGPGAFIETDNKIFFISTSLPSFELDGKEVFCISSSAPIYKELLGKKAGDTFKMGDSTLTIKSIF